MLCYVLFFFSILDSATGGDTAAYKPTDVFLINCGATSDTIDTSNRTWTTEQRNLFASNSASSFPSNASKQEPSVPLVPYVTVRIFRSNFTYSFPVTPGWKFLRLYFYPTHYGIDIDADSFLFSVTVNGFTLLRNFIKDSMAKSSGSPFLIKEFIVPVLGGHNNNNKTMMNLTLTPSPHSLAFLNGVEIVSMPDRFYTKGGFNGYIRDVGSSSDFKIEDTTVLETVYRLNVGGKMVAAVNDTGMFRQWLPDSVFILERDLRGWLKRAGISVSVPDAKINYTKKTPAYVAPEDVYRTFRSMGNPRHPVVNLNFNLTWLFPVEVGFNYLVRLHFCETMFQVTEPGQRLFSIYIGNQVAKLETDVIYLSGGPRIPVYLDFHTFFTPGANESGEVHSLRLDLNPSEDDKPKYLDAILNGIEILKLIEAKDSLARRNPSSTLGGKLHVNSNPITLGGKLHVLVIILIAVASAIGVSTFIVLFMFSMRKMKRKSREEKSVVMFKVLLKQYTFAELKKITKSFSHTVGKGGFGTVYAGNLINGCKVAVKVLKDSEGNGEDFINEVASMSQTSHVNIVSLLGFSYEGSKRAIVYEFLENGSLDQFISRENSSTLDVTTLYGIALGVARGLEYLHYGCKTRIVHFDIKPQNILLDDNLCPKVSDFGLAKLCEKRESIVSLMDARGTIGYIAPEVFSRMYGGVSHKSDVYSYGMLVLEMIGARNKETAAPNASSTYFPDSIYNDLENGEQTWRFGDEITREDEEIAKKMILVSLWCIQPCPLDRPPMNRVVEMMEGSLDSLKVPPKPSMQISTGFIGESSSLSYGVETGKTSTLDSTSTFSC